MTMVDDVKGLKEMNRVLKRLPEKTRKKVVRSALREGAKVIKEAAENALASMFSGTGNVKSNVGIAAGRSRVPFQVLYRIGIEGGAVDPEKDPRGSGEAYYWRFLEFGSSKFHARPFLRPAGEASVGRVTAIMRRKLNKGIVREARKLSRGGG
jgi:HK97 gp10 family phage protein